MREPRLTVTDLLCVWWLGSWQADAQPQCERFLRGGRQARAFLYDCFREYLFNTPDHAFNNAWEILGWEHATPAVITQLALMHLTERFLERRHGSWYVKGQQFGAWQQGLLSRMSALPLLAWAHSGDAHQGPWRYRRCRPFDPLVQDYLKREALNETHAHLNGSAYAEDVWLDALRLPDATCANFSRKWRVDPSIQDFVRAVAPRLTPSGLRSLLHRARYLRALLLAASHDATLWQPGTPLPSVCNEVHPLGKWPVSPVDEHWRGKVGPPGPAEDVSSEWRWQIRFVRQWQAHSGHELWAEYYRHYLLMFHQFYRLVVQSEMQLGFAQFDKVAQTNLRDVTEGDFTQRFKDAHGSDPRRSQIQYYEGRFAPKPEAPLLEFRLLKILQGYCCYLRDLLPPDNACRHQRPMLHLNGVLRQIEAHRDTLASRGILPLELILVCHFIKEPWTPMERRFAPYRHHALSKILRKSVSALIGILRRHPLLRRWITGVDGAGNEIHAPPEVFAPVFRMCAAHGLSHKTFHAGEDFPHLLCGIAYMHDAVELLDLREGDRLGHGTAMGIDPGLWIQRMPQVILVKRGEWFLGVLAAWRLTAARPFGLEEVIRKLELNLQSLSTTLFGETLTPYECAQAMKLRHLSMPELLRFMAMPEGSRGCNLLSDDLAHEMERIADSRREDSRALERCWRWQSDSALWRKSEALIEVSTTFLSPDEYVVIQQCLMHEVVRRGVVMETLPSSNVRISHYRGFEEHHALRWMHAPSAARAGDPNLSVALGSDDPGVFANDLEGDFYHLFFALKSSGLDANEALKRADQINAAGRIHRFQPAAAHFKAVNS